MTCTCSPLVIQTIADSVSVTLDKVQAVRQLTADHNALLANLASTVVDDLSTLVGLIPDPPTLDLTDLIGFIACPLTPMALGIDFSHLSTWDGRQIALIFRRYLRCQAVVVQVNYEDALNQLKSAEVVLQIQRYVREVHRAIQDITAFTLELPINIGHCLAIQQICPEIYSNAIYPFAALISATTDWSFDGVLPSGIDPTAISFVTPVAEAELKLCAWKNLSTLLI